MPGWLSRILRQASLATSFEKGGFFQHPKPDTDLVSGFFLKNLLTASFNLNQFTDIGYIRNWALAGMRFANYKGIIQGLNTSTLDPRGYANRAQSAAMLHRFLNFVAEQAENISENEADAEEAIASYAA